MITIIVVGISFTAAQVGLGWMVWKYRDTGQAAIAQFTRTAAIGSRCSGPSSPPSSLSRLAVMGQSVWASLRLQRCAGRVLTRLK